MVNPLETIVQNALVGLVGDVSFLGILLVGGVMGMVFLAPTSAPIKIFAFLGACLLATPIFGLAGILFGFGFGIILWMAVRRFWG
jgi:hypothetical protein